MTWLNFEKYGPRIAFKRLGESDVTYSQFAEDCDVISDALPSEKCVCLLPLDNSYESISALYGALRAGHTAILCELDNPKQQQRLIEAYDPDVIISLGTVKRLADGPINGPHHDLALVMNTSGSTGSVKGVRLSYGSLESNAADIAQYLNLTKDDVAALTLPIHYCYGLSVLNSHLLAGASIVPGSRSVADKDFRNVLQHNDVTNFPAVPYTIELLERLGFRDWNLKAFRFLTQAGGKLSPTLVSTYSEWARNTEKSFFVMYGATEATSRMSYMTHDDSVHFPDSIGRPIKSGTFALFDDNGGQIDSMNTPGMLVYFGPNVMMGYANGRKDLAAGQEIDRLITGDVAEKLENGFFRVIGRSSRFSKIFGKRQNLSDIENSLLKAGINSVAVSDDQKLYIAVGSIAQDEDIRTIVEDEFGIPKFLTVCRHFDDFPRLSSGKVDYPRVLQEMQSHEDNGLSASSRTAKTGVVDQLTHAYTEIFKKPVSPKDSFQSLGGDSLAYVQTSIAIENALGQLPQDWGELSIRQLAELRKERNSDSFIETESGVLLRMLAVVLVVLNHSGIGFLSGGALLLLFIAGYNFSRFHFGDGLVLRWRRVANSMLMFVLLPYWLFVTAYGVVKNDIDWASLALVSSYAGKTGAAGFQTWFIESLIYSMLITSILATCVNAVSKDRFRPNLEIVGWLAVGLGVALHFLQAAFLELPSTATKGGQVSWNYWIFGLGFLAATINSLRGKIAVALLLILLASSNSNDIGRQLIPIFGGLLCIFVHKVVVPKWMRLPILWISGSSLFIYMLHGRAPVESFTSDWPVDLVRVTVGITIGVVAWHAYSFALSAISTLWRAKKVG